MLQKVMIPPFERLCPQNWRSAICSNDSSMTSLRVQTSRHIARTVSRRMPRLCHFPVFVFFYLALFRGMFVAQLDVKTAFMNANPKEVVWVISHLRLQHVTSKCYKLEKVTYGWRQPHLAWYSKFFLDLKVIGFEKLGSAPCAFGLSKHRQDPEFVLVYVNDVLVLASSSTALRDPIVKQFRVLYELGVSNADDLFLVVQLNRTPGSHEKAYSLVLSQSLYIESVLRRFGLRNSKPAMNPRVECLFSGLSAEADMTFQDAEGYQEVIGFLLYLAIHTRIDIIAPVLLLARFQKSPNAYGHRAAKRILRDLRATAEYGFS